MQRPEPDGHNPPACLIKSNTGIHVRGLYQKVRDARKRPVAGFG